MLFSDYFVLGQSIVIGPSDFEWLFLNSCLGIRAGQFYSAMLFSLFRALVLGFHVFLFPCYSCRSWCKFPFSASNYKFVLASSSTFIYVSVSFTFLFIYVSVHLRSCSFTFLLHVSFAFSVWIHGRLDFLVLFPFEDEAQLSLRFRL